MIWAFDAVMPVEKEATFPRRFFETALKHELLVRPIGNTVYLMPPYILNDTDIAFLAAKTKTVFEKVIEE